MAAGQPLDDHRHLHARRGDHRPGHRRPGWTSFNGTITTKAVATQAGLNLKIAKTTLGNGAAGSTDARASGSTLAGTKVGAFTFTLGNLGWSR